jgi:hypothetical protein
MAIFIDEFPGWRSASIVYRPDNSVRPGIASAGNKNAAAQQNRLKKDEVKQAFRD